MGVRPLGQHPLVLRAGAVQVPRALEDVAQLLAHDDVVGPRLGEPAEQRHRLIEMPAALIQARQVVEGLDQRTDLAEEPGPGPGEQGVLVGHPPGTDETGDRRPGDAHCPRLEEQ